MMKKLSSMLPFFLSFVSILPHPSHSATILVDGVSELKNPGVFVGDSINKYCLVKNKSTYFPLFILSHLLLLIWLTITNINFSSVFKHKYHYNLYIFQNKKAFNLCNFTQSTILTKPHSTSFTWHPSRPGFFYFTFSNATIKSCNHQDYCQKLAFKVSPAPPPPQPAEFPPIAPAPIPSPISGDAVTSFPAHPGPFRPREEVALSPAAAPSTGASPPVTTMPTLVPDKGGGMPFINSNPAVPLPTGEVDSATIRPLPISGSGHHHPQLGMQVALGLIGVHMTLFCVVLLLLLLL